MNNEGNQKMKKATILEFRKVDTKNGKKDMIQFTKGVKIFFNDQEVDLGEYGTFFIKKKEELLKDLEFFLGKDYMTQERYDQQVERIEEKQITASLTVNLK